MITHTYTVSGGVGQAPGAVGPGEFEGRWEWVSVRRRASILDVIAARLGSEVDLRKVVLAVLAPLCAALEGPALDAVVEAVPFPLSLELRESDRNLNARIRRPTGDRDYLLEVAELIQHPPSGAAFYVRAVLGATRRALGERAALVTAQLPPDLARLWQASR